MVRSRVMSFLQALPSILAIVALIVKMFLDEFGKDRQERRDEKAAVARTLAELLEMRYQLRGIALLQKSLRDWLTPLGMPAGGEVAIIAQFKDWLPAIDDLKGRYETAVSLIAATDPFLAFQLRSKDLGPSLLARLRKQVAADPKSILLWTLVEPELASALVADLDRLIRELAARHSRKAKKDVEGHLSKPFPDAETQQKVQGLLATVAQGLQPIPPGKLPTP